MKKEKRGKARRKAENMELEEIEKELKTNESLCNLTKEAREATPEEIKKATEYLRNLKEGRPEK